MKNSAVSFSFYLLATDERVELLSAPAKESFFSLKKVLLNSNMAL